MDVERTIEFMLKNQARSDARFNAKFERTDEHSREALPKKFTNEANRLLKTR